MTLHPLLTRPTTPIPGTNSVMHNYGGGVYGYQTMQKSLRYSYNTPVARIDDQILGSVRIKTFLHGLGLDVQDTYSAVTASGFTYRLYRVRRLTMR